MTPLRSPDAQQRPRWPARLAPLLAVSAGVALLVGGCEATFDPFEESDVAFSLFGYLDVSADTQYVRVGALQQTAFEGATVEATVVLEDLDRGETFPMRDSVVAFTNGAAVHNFWTPTPVRPSTAYRLSASAPDGRSASVSLRTPAVSPPPTLNAGVSRENTPTNLPFIQSITLAGVETLADLRVLYYLDDPDIVLPVSYFDRVRRGTNENLIVAFNAYEDVQIALSGTTGQGCPGLFRAEVFVAAATEDWPDFATIDIETLALPSAVTNVEGGLGYVGGVQTTRVEWPGMPTVFALHRAACL